MNCFSIKSRPATRFFLGSRRGTTLVEVLVVITLTSLVLGTVGVLLHGVWRIERSMSQHRVALDSLVRLAAVFRSDVHSASTAESPVPQNTLILPGGKTIEYQGETSRVTRLVRSGGQAAHRETFVLPPEGSASWRLSSAAAKQQVSMHISWPMGMRQREFSARRELRIDAALGLCPPEVQLQGETP